jgi:hypothetical protein
VGPHACSSRYRPYTKTTITIALLLKKYFFSPNVKTQDRTIVETEGKTQRAKKAKEEEKECRSTEAKKHKEKRNTFAYSFYLPVLSRRKCSFLFKCTAFIRTYWQSAKTTFKMGLRGETAKGVPQVDL